MMYAKEVIGLLSPFPGRDFKMIEIIRGVAGRKPGDRREWERLRKGIRRVLEDLERANVVLKRPSTASNGGYATYRWKPGHEVVAKRD